MQQNERNKCLGPFKCQVPKLLNLINLKMVPNVKEISLFSVSLLMFSSPFPLLRQSIVYSVLYGGKFWQGNTLASWLVLSIWEKKIWWINRLANGLLMINTNLDGFSLPNHGRFAKFANVSSTKVSLHTVFIMFVIFPHLHLCIYMFYLMIIYIIYMMHLHVLLHQSVTEVHTLLWGCWPLTTLSNL